MQPEILTSRNDAIAMAGIPEDLIVEILLRLPVMSLLQFRCVSKRWRNLIDSPNFVKSQLNLPNKPQFVMMALFFENLLFYYSELDSKYIENPSPNYRELTNSNFSFVSAVVGYCNGLVCCIYRTDYSFLILNPSTKKYIRVAPTVRRPDKLWEWGFGYDKDSEDYKIVGLEYPFENWGSTCKVWIYSLKSGSWSIIADYPYDLYHTDGVFVNGVLHWIVDRIGDPLNSIFALHLGTLQHSLLAPPSDTSKNLSLLNLGVLDGNLYAICSEYPENDDEDIAWYDVWVMKEYGLEESWTRLGTYDGSFSNRDVLFVTYGNSLVQCRFGSFRSKIWLSGLDGFGEQHGKPLVYEPSLVCP